MQPVIEWNKERVTALLDSSKGLRIKALLALYDAQTADERAGHQTKHSNGVGFNKFDAEFMSSLAVQARKKGFLSAKQMQVLRRKLPYYWRQIAPLIEPEKAQAVEARMEAADQRELFYGSW
jgi:hypothetical protein